MPGRDSAKSRSSPDSSRRAASIQFRNPDLTRPGFPVRGQASGASNPRIAVRGLRSVRSCSSCQANTRERIGQRRAPAGRPPRRFLWHGSRRRLAKGWYQIGTMWRRSDSQNGGSDSCGVESASVCVRRWNPLRGDRTAVESVSGGASRLAAAMTRSWTCRNAPPLRASGRGACRGQDGGQVAS